ncbi:hypothetical protein LJK88_06510 [Paenibacillus sp. P26]|nr:hypothetical protein LJK88_06510 [Paenibacillus sp. P26]
MFLQTNIPAGNNFGVVARTSIRNANTSASASAYFYDLAYISDSGNASQFASTVGSHSRGHAGAFYNTFYFDTIAPTDRINGMAYTVGGSGDTFSGSDRVYVWDDAPSSQGNMSGPLDGNFGIQMDIHLPIKNNLGYDSDFRVFIGSIGGYAFPFANMNGISAQYFWVPPFQYVDVIDTGTIKAGGSYTASFFAVVPAVSSAPWVIGAAPA